MSAPKEDGGKVDPGARMNPGAKDEGAARVDAATGAVVQKVEPVKDAAGAMVQIVEDLTSLVLQQQQAYQTLLDDLSAAGATNDPAVAEAINKANLTDQKVNDAIAAGKAAVEQAKAHVEQAKAGAAEATTDPSEDQSKRPAT